MTVCITWWSRTEIFGRLCPHDFMLKAHESYIWFQNRSSKMSEMDLCLMISRVPPKEQSKTYGFGPVSMLICWFAMCCVNHPNTPCPQGAPRLRARSDWGRLRKGDEGSKNATSSEAKVWHCARHRPDTRHEPTNLSS